MKWVTAFAESQCGNYMYRMNVGGRTFRTVLRLPFGGKKLRLTIASMYGTELSIGAMSVTSGGVCRKVTVAGRSAFTVKKNQRFLSDEIELETEDGGEVEIRTYFAGGKCQSGLWKATTYSVPGDFTEGEFLSSDDDLWAREKRPLDIGIPLPAVTGIDVYTPYEDARAVAILGASNEYLGRWVGPVQKKAEETDPHTAILNLSISGNRLMKDTGSNYLLRDLFGDNAFKRFDEEVKNFSEVRVLVICVGCNDLFQPHSFACYPWEKTPSAKEMEEGYTKMAQKAHEAGMKAVGVTVSPFKYGDKVTEDKLAIRKEVNEWILSTDVFDACFDIAAPIRDPEDPESIREGLVENDHVHFSVEGGKAIAEAFPMELLRL